MKKQLVLLLFGLLFVSELLGEFSIDESPNGHIYSPSFLQSESFSTISITSNLTIESATANPVLISDAVLNSGATTITLENIDFSSLLDLQIDGVLIPEQNIDQVGENVVAIVTGLPIGPHTITYKRFVFMLTSFVFYVSDASEYFDNSYAMIFLMYNGISFYKRTALSK